jgi:predicted RNA-binding Zn ribbon-like protein
MMVSVAETAEPLAIDDEQLLLAVANTGHLEVDELSDTASVDAWWACVQGRAWSGDLGTEADLEVLRAARRMIRALTLRNNGIDVPTETDAALLGQVPLTFDLAERPDLMSDDRASLPRFVAGRAVVALVRAASQPHWRRVKACPGPGCAWVFVDRSRNGSRRWCDMAECGNRAKGAAFRARTRST